MSRSAHFEPWLPGACTSHSTPTPVTRGSWRRAFSPSRARLSPEASTTQSLVMVRLWPSLPCRIVAILDPPKEPTALVSGSHSNARQPNCSSAPQPWAWFANHWRNAPKSSTAPMGWPAIQWRPWVHCSLPWAPGPTNCQPRQRAATTCSGKPKRSRAARGRAALLKAAWAKSLRRSTSTTSTPAWARSLANSPPEGPAPTTRTWQWDLRAFGVESREASGEGETRVVRPLRPGPYQPLGSAMNCRSAPGCFQPSGAG